MIAFEEIQAAAQRLNAVCVRTPLLQNHELDKVAGGTVLLKPECLQVTGSFKLRGAYNRLSQLQPEARASGVVAWSSGNHAQGVAAAAAMLGMHAAIVMPKDAPTAKLANTRKLGGEVISYDRYTGDRERIARDLAEVRGAALVPSYDHEHVIAGQGTVGLEIAEDALELQLPPDQVLIPCGGGGLSGGCSVALKALLPDMDLFPVEPSEFDDTARSFASGLRESVDTSARSICDALQSPRPGKLTFPLLQRHASGILTVTDAEVREAIRFAFKHLKLVVEPGDAVGLAAILAGKLDTRGKTTAIVLSGGNIDVELFARIQAEPK
ncbi:MAG: threonine/serine dehydratase [Gammaproteobacteria bacterium]|nr:threonine/serine dehydratase [Gammaproteobacteria bacterium]